MDGGLTMDISWLVLSRKWYFSRILRARSYRSSPKSWSIFSGVGQNDNPLHKSSI